MALKDTQEIARANTLALEIEIKVTVLIKNQLPRATGERLSRAA